MVMMLVMVVATMLVTEVAMVVATMADGMYSLRIVVAAVCLVVTQPLLLWQFPLRVDQVPRAGV